MTEAKAAPFKQVQRPEEKSKRLKSQEEIDELYAAYSKGGQVAAPKDAAKQCPRCSVKFGFFGASKSKCFVCMILYCEKNACLVKREVSSGKQQLVCLDCATYVVEKFGAEQQRLRAEKEEAERKLKEEQARRIEEEKAVLRQQELERVLKKAEEARLAKEAAEKELLRPKW